MYYNPLSLKEKLLKQTIEIVSGILLLYCCSKIKIPLYPVPITLQTVGVIFIGLRYEKYSGLFTILLYILLGISGAPIFSNATSSIEDILGPTGGYIIGFILAIYCICTLKDLINIKNKIIKDCILAILGNTIIMLTGYLWLAKHLGFNDAFIFGVLPFLVPGIIKSLFLCYLLNAIKSQN